MMSTATLCTGCAKYRCLFTSLLVAAHTIDTLCLCSQDVHDRCCSYMRKCKWVFCIYEMIDYPEPIRAFYHIPECVLIAIRIPPHISCSSFQEFTLSTPPTPCCCNGGDLSDEPLSLKQQLLSLSCRTRHAAAQQILNVLESNGKMTGCSL